MEENKIETGDVVVLKSDAGESVPQKFTVGDNLAGGDSSYLVYWYDYKENELKTKKVNINIFQKSE